MSSWTVTLYQEASELNTNFILYTFRALYFLMQLFMSRKDKAPELLSGLYLTTLFTQLILLKTLNECLENNRALQYRGKIHQGWENTMYLLLRSIVLVFFFFSKFIDNKDKKNLENYLFYPWQLHWKRSIIITSFETQLTTTSLQTSIMFYSYPQDNTHNKYFIEIWC